MIAQGAEIIDIGGESTGPGSLIVNVGEELRRVIPVIERLKVAIRPPVQGLRTLQGLERRAHGQEAGCRLQVSVDTYKVEVARQALAAGADMINDVTAGRQDPRMFDVIAESGCLFVMMRSKDNSPRTTVRSVQYTDVLKTIHDFFEERIAAALKAGIRKEQLILDPGLGHFVSSVPEYSWEILECLEFLQDFGCPILVSPSRKSFTAGPENLPLEKRLAGTLEATKKALMHGVTIIRTHDVEETCHYLPPVPPPHRLTTVHSERKE